MLKTDAFGNIIEQKIIGDGHTYERVSQLVESGSEVFASIGFSNSYTIRKGRKLLRFNDSLSNIDTIDLKNLSYNVFIYHSKIKADPQGGFLSGSYEHFVGGRYGPNKTISLTRDSTYNRTNNGFA